MGLLADLHWSCLAEYGFLTWESTAQMRLRAAGSRSIRYLLNCGVLANELLDFKLHHLCLSQHRRVGPQSSPKNFSVEIFQKSSVAICAKAFLRSLKPSTAQSPRCLASIRDFPSSIEKNNLIWEGHNCLIKIIMALNFPILSEAEWEAGWYGTTFGYFDLGSA